MDDTDKSRGQPRVLVVEDDKGVQAVYRRAFASTDWHVEFATSAEEALELTATQAFDVYVVDKNLPGMTGVEFVREMRKSDDVARCLMVTGYASMDSAIETANLRVDAYVEKPFSVLDLLGKVKELVATGPARRSPAEKRLSHFFATGEAQKEEEREATDERTGVLVARADPELREQITRHLSTDRHRLEFVDTLSKVSLSDGAPEYSVVFGRIGGTERETADVEVDWMVRARSSWPDAVFVVVSERADVEAVTRLLDAGVTAILDRHAAWFEENLENISSILLD